MPHIVEPLKLICETTRQCVLEQEQQVALSHDSVQPLVQAFLDAAYFYHLLEHETPVPSTVDHDVLIATQELLIYLHHFQQ
ncbi:hypothetical protein [Sporisorium scitamineum]|uniref:Uncharacterized protein n=1 Tax=Sporisorium scitamineum TaxID=49012 RepID=A0A0F7S412_9BASI|nr:hypothetical protein [Sporisorium scitamineum]